MDGYRRWDHENAHSAISGHDRGAHTLTNISRGVARLKIPFLTVFAFSAEKHIDEPFPKVRPCPSNFRNLSLAVITAIRAPPCSNAEKMVEASGRPGSFTITP